MKKHLHADYTPIIVGLIVGMLFACLFVYPSVRDIAEGSTPDRMVFIGMIDDSGSKPDSINLTATNNIATAAAGFEQFRWKHYESAHGLRLFQNSTRMQTARVPVSPLLAQGTKEITFEDGRSKIDIAVEDAIRDIEVLKPEHEHRVLLVVADSNDSFDSLKTSDKMSARLAKDEVSLYFIQFKDFQSVPPPSSHILLVYNQESFNNALELVYAAEHKEAEAQSKMKQVWSAFTVILTAAFMLLFLLGFLCCWGLVKCRSRTKASR